jgi:hypothetical protein
MIICTDPEFVFVAMPRTASRSMNRWLLDRFPKAAYSGDHHETDIPNHARGFFRFAVVRNPFSLHLSHYLYRKSRDQNNMHGWCRSRSFLEYLRWISNPLASPIQSKEPPQSVTMARVEPDVVLRYESLTGGLESLPFVDTVENFPHRYGNREYDLAEHYADDRCRQLVMAFAGGDFIEYNYPFYRIPK